MRVGSYAAETGEIVSLEGRRDGSARRGSGHYPNGTEVKHFPERRRDVVRGILLGQPTRQDYKPLSEMTPEEMEMEALRMTQLYSDFPDIANEMDRLNQLGREIGRRQAEEDQLNRTVRLFTYLGKQQRKHEEFEEWVNNPKDPTYRSRRI